MIGTILSSTSTGRDRSSKASRHATDFEVAIQDRQIQEIDWQRNKREKKEES
jgi:hypothetical protein